MQRKQNNKKRYAQNINQVTMLENLNDVITMHSQKMRKRQRGRALKRRIGEEMRTARK